MNRPTPETDELHSKMMDKNPGNYIYLEEFLKLADRLERERDDLQQWKKEMLLVESQWDEQVVGRLLGLKLGQKIKPNIEPKLRQLIRECDEAREAIRALAEHGESEIQRITKERDEAREELENEMKWHHQTHKELVEAQCKLLDIEYDKLKG